MSRTEYLDHHFAWFAIRVFQLAGHAVTVTPQSPNRTWRETVYIDSQKDIPLSREVRETLELATNISLLFELAGVFDNQASSAIRVYSIVLQEKTTQRSQCAYNAHVSLHQFFGCRHSIVIFKCNDHCMLSFAEDNAVVGLSDWYPITDEGADQLVKQIDIGATSYHSAVEFFHDIYYAAARWYYVYGLSKEFARFELCPPDYSMTYFIVGYDNETAVSVQQDVLLIAETEYGDDFVEQLDFELPTHGSSENLEMLIFELELDENSIHIDFEDDTEFDEDDSDFDENDEDEYEDVDPRVFDDPTLMIRWLEERARTGALNKIGEIDDE